MVPLRTDSADLGALDAAELLQPSVVLLDPPAQVRVVGACGFAYLGFAGRPVLGVLRAPVWGCTRAASVALTTLGLAIRYWM